MPITFETDRPLLRSTAPSSRHVLARIQAPVAPRAAERPPVAIGIVLDRSGSMTGEKFRLARLAVSRALAMLSDSDRFCLTIFDHEVTSLSTLVPATASNRQLAIARLSEVAPRGSTDLFAAWCRTVEQLVPARDLCAVQRCLLLTDGLANQGETNPDIFGAVAQRLRGVGVTTSAFGIGEDFDEHLLREITVQGTGHFYFVERAEQIVPMLSGELGEALDVTLRQAVLRLEVEESVVVESVDGRPLRRSGDYADVPLGDLVSGEQLDILLRFRFPTGHPGTRIVARAFIDDVNGGHSEVAEPVEWCFASATDVAAQTRSLLVDRATANGYAQAAIRRAAAMNRAGEIAEAGRTLRATARRIRDYAGGDEQMLAVARGLETAAREYGGRRIGAGELKQAVFDAHLAERGREGDGRAKRQS